MTSIATASAIVLTVAWNIGSIWLAKAYEDTPVGDWPKRETLLTRLFLWVLLTGILVLVAWGSVLTGAWE